MGFSCFGHGGEKKLQGTGGSTNGPTPARQALTTRAIPVADIKAHAKSKAQAGNKKVDFKSLPRGQPAKVFIPQGIKPPQPSIHTQSISDPSTIPSVPQSQSTNPSVSQTSPENERLSSQPLHVHRPVLPPSTISEPEPWTMSAVRRRLSQIPEADLKAKMKEKETPQGPDLSSYGYDRPQRTMSWDPTAGKISAVDLLGLRGPGGDVLIQQERDKRNQQRARSGRFEVREQEIIEEQFIGRPK